MDRKELKQTLRNQATSIDEAVQKKLAYLTGDNPFAVEEDNLTDNAFTELLMNDNTAPIQPKTISEPLTVEDKISAHKQSLAEKIAALRGISTPIPSGYIHRKF